MITSGLQIRGARAMLGLRVEDLAAEAAISPNGLRYWEARSVIPRRRGEARALKAVREALARLGIEVFADPDPGVRLRLRSCRRQAPDQLSKEMRRGH